MKKARFWIAFALLLSIAVPVSAAEPYTNYNFNRGFVSQEPQAYTVSKVWDAYSIGIESLDNIPFSGPADFVLSPADGSIVIADTGNNRIVILDKNFKVKQIIGNQTMGGAVAEPTDEATADPSADPTGEPQTTDSSEATTEPTTEATDEPSSDATEPTAPGASQGTVATPGQGDAKYFPTNGAKVYPVKNGQSDSKEYEAFNAPAGVSFAADGALYVCDTGNRRIIRFVLNADGVFVCDAFFNDPDIARYISGTSGGASSTTEPTAAPDATEGDGAEEGGETETDPGATQAPAKDERFIYQPTAVVIDEGNRMYVVAKGCYQGLIELSSDGTFTKFVGATKTTANISAIWRRLISEKQRESLEQSLSTEYTNAFMDADGMIFGTIGNIEAATLESHFKDGSEIGAAIKRIAPTGSDILKRNDVYPPSGDRGYDTSDREKWSFFVDVCVADDGIYSALDRNKGRVFTYNAEGELLYIFGALGNVNGAFTQPAAIGLFDQSTIGVLDSQTAQLTIFELTDFGRKIRNATLLQTDREYDQAMSLWQEVVNESSNSRLAYTNIARIQYIRGQYEECCENYRRAFNRQGYSEAYAKLRNEKLEVLMPYIMTVLVVLIVFFVGKACVKRVHSFIKRRGKGD